MTKLGHLVMLLRLRKGEMKMSDKFGEAIGIWNVTVGGGDLDLKPQM